MPYLAAKPRLIGGKSYQRGEAVDTSAFSIAKLGSLIRAGLLIQDDQAEAHGVAPLTEGDNCPICNGGPYKRLEQHITRTHKE